MLKKLDYKIIGSGSSGNAVRIENIMIDCGLPYKKMKDDLQKVDTVLITHSHSDHIKLSTYEAIRNDFPEIRFFGNAHVAYQYRMDTIIGSLKMILPKKRIIIPYEGSHDVPVNYFVIKMKGLNILYCTDTHRVNNPGNIPFDYLFLESNYDERKLAELSKQYKRRGYNPAESNLRHLSTQKCKEFYYLNRRNNESKLIELHKSSRFY